MENLLLSVNVVAPLVVYMLTGALLRKTGLVSRQSFREISQIIFYIAIPALCIENLRVLDLRSVFSDPFALYIGAGIILLFVLCMVIVPLCSKNNRRRGVLVQGIFRSNDGIFGIAVGAALLGESHMGGMIICVAITIPIFNLLSILAMELYRGGKPKVGHMLRQLIKNPILIGCVIGLLLSAFSVDVPLVLAKPLAGIAALCAPLGFLALGGTLTFSSLRENRLAISVAALLRLVIIPVVFVGGLYLLGYRGDQILIATVIFGAPTAFAVYPMACGMNGDETLASGIIAVTSVLSMLTMFLFIFLLKQTGVA